ncbi:MAG: 16S rRNA (guanine(966)-N(2))-methyltransferase RsmD [Clostridia bacterium]|jgi:16S rRNA (guanine966-N2)-methyltransferase|nr:16S rRNA (guanine(966)-N(2))-methyltransferase RsmD [Clostridia bacterium]
MRIISGKAKGLILKAPKGYHTRPTSDRVKEAMFSIIQDLIPDALALDLFAGTGALGLEAWSRGAKRVIFVEPSSLARRVLSANIAKAGIASQAIVSKLDALSFLKKYDEEPFDLIFMDPPYDNEISINVLDTIVAKKLLAPNGILVWEKSSKDSSFQPVSGLKLVKEKQYGDTMLLFLEQIKEE